MDTTWISDKNLPCKAVGLDLFFSDSSSGHAQAARKDANAKQTCRGCHRRVECLAYAYATNTRDGVWGGSTYEERVWLQAHPQEASEVAEACEQAKVHTDDLNAWYQQVGPDGEVDERLGRKPYEVAVKYGVRYPVYRRWVRNRRQAATPVTVGGERETRVEVRNDVGYTYLGTYLRYWLLVRAGHNGGWVERSYLIDLVERLLEDHPLTEVRISRANARRKLPHQITRRSCLDYLTQLVIRPGLRSGWLERKDVKADNGRKRMLVRIAPTELPNVQDALESADLFTPAAKSPAGRVPATS